MMTADFVCSQLGNEGFRFLRSYAVLVYSEFKFSVPLKSCQCIFVAWHALTPKAVPHRPSNEENLWHK